MSNRYMHLVPFCLLLTPRMLEAQGSGSGAASQGVSALVESLPVILLILIIAVLLFLGRHKWGTRMSSGYSLTYDTARGVARIISLSGWTLVALGIVAVAVLAQQAGGLERLLSGVGAIGAIVSLLVSVAGLLLVTSGQLLRATVDTADNSGQMLQLLAIIKATLLEAKQHKD